MDNDETALESKILDALLSGDDPILETLRKQRQIAIIKDREFTGCGFFTTFEFQNEIPCVDPKNFVIDDVALEVEGTENGASAMLFVRDGRINFLEVVAHTGSWPKTPILKKVLYFKRKSMGSFDELIAQDGRDIEVTRRAWKK